MNAYDNKFLIVKPSVRLTPIIIPVIIGMDKYFQEANVIGYVTSGQRSSMDQLETIRKYAVRYKIDKEFPEILTTIVMDKNEDGTYVWQRPWSRLLNRGIIINPPMPAKVLFDYIRNGKNKKGAIIGHSPHHDGRAFDIGGNVDHDITNELPPVQKAFADKLPGMKGFLPERNNNCIHIDCLPISVVA